MRVCVFYNALMGWGLTAASQAAEHICARGVDVEIAQLPEQDGETACLAGCDVAIAYGGDGTVLTLARQAAPLGIPVLGINIGRVGFLCGAELEEQFSALDRLVAGDYSIRERGMLMATSGGESFYALNDIVIRNMHSHTMMRAELYCADGLVENYACDGLLFSTPTGSTAYALSCGGPLVSPELDCTLILPICSHSLSTRPILMPAAQQLRAIPTAGTGPWCLVADGLLKREIPQAAKQEVLIAQAPMRAKFIKLRSDDFFDQVRRKFYTPIS